MSGQSDAFGMAPLPAGVSEAHFRRGEHVSYSGSYRVGIIGHTGQGNYGHGLDKAYVGLLRVEVVAVADANEAGRLAAVPRTGAARSYADYHEMLAREKPDVVSVGPSNLAEHLDMIVAAAESGARAIYCEKPLAQSMADADRMLEACDANGVTMAVAHQNRAFPAPWLARQLIAEGKIGRIRAMRAWPKQDTRGAGLELLIHGTHTFDLMRFFGGDARWCHARVMNNARDAVPGDVFDGIYTVGPVTGDDMVAEYGFDRGIVATYEAMRSDDGGGSNHLRMEILGTAGILAFWSSYTSPLYLSSRAFHVPDEPQAWQRIEPAAKPIPDGYTGIHVGNQMLVCDLLAAVEAGREPLTSGRDARASMEMSLAAYAAHALQRRVALPLEERRHPLEVWQTA